MSIYLLTCLHLCPNHLVGVYFAIITSWLYIISYKATAALKLNNVDMHEKMPNVFHVYSTVSDPSRKNWETEKPLAWNQHQSRL